MNDKQEIVLNSFENSPLSIEYGKDIRCTPLSASGSSRRYFRIQSDAKDAKSSHFLGVYNSDLAENAAYIDFSRQFTEKKLAVPKILYFDPNLPVYFVEDAGEKTLFDFLSLSPQFNSASGITPEEPILSLYSKVITNLLEFQYIGGKNFDYDKAYPCKTFDRKAMLWDLSYFKYYFLKLSGTIFDEQKLEKDFDTLLDFLQQCPTDIFMSRDFQSRNIMIGGEDQATLSFIDFQGGRRGPAAYDLASLLFEAKANLSDEMRKTLLDKYIELSHLYTIPDSRFRSWFYGFVFLRIFQAMGAYGLRGLYERKTVFLQSIPHAIKNLHHLLEEGKLPVKLPHIESLIRNLYNGTMMPKEPSLLEKATTTTTNDTATTSRLTLRVYSFSFRKTPPEDNTGNGGGFVFDCRGLPNPGRLQEFKNLTGRDASVRVYLSQYPQVDSFIENCIAVVSTNVLNYIERGFKHLYVAFACTGGQHRSVYCAEEFKNRMLSKFNIDIELVHIEHP